MIKYAVKVSDYVDDDVDAIYKYILKKSFSIHSAEKWIRKIYDRIESLSTWPERYARFRFDDQARITHVGRYSIIYDVYNDIHEVLVLRVVYSRRNVAKLELSR